MSPMGAITRTSGYFTRQSSAPQPLVLAGWLLTIALLVIAIVVVGGITRLTESGLSITEWKPVTGALPPLTEAQWQTEFSAYQRIPQFTQVNGPAGMTLADYKFIFFWEWAHRLLARTIGLVFILPLVWFWVRGNIPTGYKPRLLALLIMGGLQGVVGWWMVSSGLTDNADVKVSHFRLAIHLLIALATLAGLVWTALDLKALARGRAVARPTGLGALGISVLFLQLGLGALVAGLRAGPVASDWPLMQGAFFPAGVDWNQGVVHALLYDPFLTQFVHRWWAWVVVAVLIKFGRQLDMHGMRASKIAIHTALGAQVLLGIATVMSGVALWLAVLHQLVAACLVVVTVGSAYSLGTKRR